MLTKAKMDKLAKELEKCKQTNTVNEFLSSLYSLNSLVNRLRQGIEPEILADLCGIKEEVFLYKLKLLGYDEKGNLIDKTSSTSEQLKSNNTITKQEREEIKGFVKHGKDIIEIAEMYGLDVGFTSRLLLEIRREIDEENIRFYKLDMLNLKRFSNKFDTLYVLGD